MTTCKTPKTEHAKPWKLCLLLQDNTTSKIMAEDGKMDLHQDLFQFP